MSTSTTRSVVRFDRLAADCLNSEAQKTSPSIEQLHRLLPDSPDIAICDVACGAGHLTASFIGRSRRIVAVDPSPDMLDLCRRLLEDQGATAEFIPGDAKSIPLPDRQFDATISRLAAHHFTNIETAVAEMVRITKPGGLVAVIDLEGSADLAADEFNHELEVMRDPAHVRSYPASTWQRVFEQAGLVVERLETKLSERPAGITVQQWCESAASGEEVAAAIREMLRQAPATMLMSLGIRRSGAEFLLPIRTLLMAGRKPAFI